MNENLNSVCNQDALEQALAYVGMNTQLETLRAKRINCDNGNYFIAFIGQFSAGKSCLINNLIKRSILPEGSLETTPILTYIRYGNPEVAILHYRNGSQDSISVDRVKSIIQITKDTVTYDLAQMEYIEIFLNSEFLEQGMILVDTPGVNTLITRHEELLSKSMEIAARVVYVAGHSPSRVDVEKITVLNAAGLPSCYVRTHFDQVDPTEENEEDAKATDTKILETCGLTADQCFFVSNISDSKWFAEISAVRQMLCQSGHNARHELNASVKAYESILSEKCLAILTQRAEELNNVKSGNDQALEARKAEIQNRITAFERVVDKRQKRLQEMVIHCQNQLNEDVRHDLNIKLERSAKVIASAPDSVQTPEQMSQLMQGELMRLGLEANAGVSSVLDPILHDIQNTESDVSECEFILDFTGAPEPDSYSELEHEQDYRIIELTSKLKALQANRIQLEQQLTGRINDPDYVELQEDLRALEAEIIECQALSDDLPPYEPRMIEVNGAGTQPSDVLGTIGSTLDWVFLFVDPTHAATKVGTILKSASKSEKLVKIGAKILGTVEKIGGTAKKVDTGKDILYTIRGISRKITGADKRSKVYATQRRKEAVQNALNKAADTADRIGDAASKGDAPSFLGFLDYLTIEHWARELGKQFDEQPKLEVDKEYEEAYLAQKREITERLRQQQRKGFEKKKELGLFASETQRMQAERDAAIVDEEALQAELTKLQGKLRRKAEINARLRWRDECSRWFRDHAQLQINSFLKKNISSVPDRLAMYQDEILMQARTNLENEQQAYQNVCALPKGEAEQTYDTIASLINELKLLSRGTNV